MKKLYAVCTLLITAFAASATTDLTIDRCTSERINDLPARSAKTLSIEESAVTATKTVCNVPAGEWKVLGNGTFADDIFGFGRIPGEQWSVTIEESKTTPGWYRFIPYNENSPVADHPKYGVTDTYLYINATNPDKVYTEDFDVFNKPLYQFCEESEIGAMVAQQNGLDFSYGTLSDNVITFPASSHCIVITENGTKRPYFANNLGRLAIALPGAEIPYDWEIVGNGNFEDGVFASSAGQTTQIKSEVAVERHKTKPTTYRAYVWKPYLSYLPLEFDISNPDCVYVPMQSTGINYPNHGITFVVGGSALFDSEEDFFASKYAPLVITLKDNVISFPKDALLINWPDFDKEGLYNLTGSMPSKLTMPTSGVEDIPFNEDAPVEYFNLQGAKVERPVKGFYIKRQGLQTTKVFFR